ncbi:hypothetical protein [Chamaesiphon sp. OTE_75_metabat_556]|uniref:hypothetical protein n=1 Tax=Chamaesiphon sp. OTE_75_metabat_556 TaxID=2964692 RepID=UPI00286D5D19|nr:hypothetical protein [Chamaesiphon sp. OTE_75_metabat_556]
MDAQQAVRSLDLLLDRAQQRRLNDLESTIVLGIWAGGTYKSIADRLSYETDYIKHVAARLWKLLSKLLGESICKGNIRSTLERCQASISVRDRDAQSEIDYCDETTTNFQFSEDWMVADRCHSIVFFESGGITQSAQLMTIDVLDRSPLPANKNDRNQGFQAKVIKQHLQTEIQSSILQNLDRSVDSEKNMNNIFAILKELDPNGNAINCLIINYYS